MKISIIGNGSRAINLYIPLLQKIDGIEFRGICGSSYEKTLVTSRALGVYGYKDIDEVLNDTKIDCIIACVGWTENANLYTQLASSTKALLLETPLGHDSTSIKKCFEALSNRTAFTGVAEQYPLRPIETIKIDLIKQGLFGNVFYAFNDGVGHEYHGMSLIRSYLGCDQTLRRVFALQKDVPIFPHAAHKNIFFEGERIQQCILEFHSGAQAFFRWSWLNYCSPIRAHRRSGFHGTKGAANGADCVAFSDIKALPSPVFFERRTRVLKGIEILMEIIAHYDEQVVARWCNPFPELSLNEDEIVASIFVQNMIEGAQGIHEPLYSVERAYQDHSMVEMMNSFIRENP